MLIHLLQMMKGLQVDQCERQKKLLTAEQSLQLRERISQDYKKGNKRVGFQHSRALKERCQW
jgi:hypothetical protein